MASVGGYLNKLFLQGIPAPENRRGVLYLISMVISLVRISASAEFNLDLMCLAVAGNGNDTSADLGAVNSKLLDTLVHVSGVLDLDLVNVASELTDSFESVPSRRDGRIDGKTVKLRLNAEDVL